MRPKGKRPDDKQFDRRDRGPRDRDHGNRRPEPVESPSSVIYGVLPVLEALRAENRRIDKVWIADGSRESRLSEIIELSRSQSIAWNKVPRESFAKFLAAGVNHQGVMAFASAVDYVSTDDILERASELPLLLVLDGIEDPRNLGALLRTAECAGADGIVIPERRAVGLNDTVAKSSAGAIEFVKVAKTGNLNRFIEELKARDIWVVGTSSDAKLSYSDWDWTRPSALVMGSEGSGLHRLVAENCDVLVNIPMYGRIDSLNVSVAAGVVLFEAKRQRTAAADRPTSE